MTLAGSLLFAVLALHPAYEVIRMALPPQKPQALRENAERIVVGELTALYQRTVNVAHGTDHEYVALVKADGEEAPLYVHFRRTGTRPAGWTGPTGQHRVPEVGSRLRLYLVRGHHRAWALLEPNGWEPA